MEKILNFLKINNGSGSGSGSGDGSGDSYGSGSGYGSGYGYGYDYGDGYGYGYGDGYGYGYGEGVGSGSGEGVGSGYGYGSGSGYGYGEGVGSGYDINIYNKEQVYIIDDIQTIIHSVHNNYAKCSIINKDLTLTSCFVVKCGNYFAHGKTLKQASTDATFKYNNNLPEEERIKSFLNTFDLKKKYSCKLFYTWHTILTGSCTFGKESFIKEHSIKLTDKITVKEFLELTKNSYGKEIINKILLLIK